MPGSPSLDSTRPAARPWRRPAPIALAAATVLTGTILIGAGRPMPAAAACAVNARLGLGSQGNGVSWDLFPMLGLQRD